MLARLLFFALLIGNIAYYAWYSVAAEPVQEVPLPAVDAGIPKLVLLREKEEELLANSWDGAPADSACFSLGPFVTQSDLRRAITAMTPFVDRIRQRQVVQTLDRGFWVYLSAMATRDEALAAARQLSLAGLNDYYVVTTGDRENTVSLGLFREEENARRRLSALISLGFDAQMTRRTEDSLIYYLDYQAAPGQAAPWQRVVASGLNIEHQPVPCFN